MKKVTKKFFSTDEFADGIRINKYLSDAGVCSRREADKHIERKEVTIDGVTAVMGDKVFTGQKVSVLGKLIKADDQLILIAFHKPKGIVCTTDPRDPDNIIDYINYGKRIYPIGRLDKDSEGLILLTNHGDIVNKILRAGNHHEKEYIVTVNKPLTAEFLKEMATGVPILDTVTKPCTVEMIDKTSFRIVLTQGLNRQVRRMCEYFDFRVRHLQRIRVMNINLGRLTLGGYRNLTDWELEELNLLIKDSTNASAISTEEKVEKNPEYSAISPVMEQKPKKSSYKVDKAAKYKTARTKYVQKTSKDDSVIEEKKQIGSGSMERYAVKDGQRPAKGRFAEQKTKKSEYSSNRFERTKKLDRTEKVDSTEKFDRAEKSDRTKKFDRNEKLDKTKKFDRTEKPDRTKKFDRTERSDRIKKFDSTEKLDRTKKFDRNEKPDRTKKFDRTERSDRIKKFDSTEKLDRTKKFDRTGKIDNTEKFDRTKNFNRTGKSDSTKKFDKTEKFDRTKKFDRTEKFDRTKKSDRFEKSEKSTRFDKNRTERSNDKSKVTWRSDIERGGRKESTQNNAKWKSTKPEFSGKPPETSGSYKKGTDRKKIVQKASEQSSQTRRQDDGAKKGTYQRTYNTARSGKQGLRTGRSRNHK